MKQRWILIGLLTACGDNGTDPMMPPIDMPPDASIPVAKTCDETKLADTLRALPNVSSVTQQPCGNAVRGTATCFAITYDQLVRHDDPQSPRFPQHLFLTHRSCERPLLVADWGYSQDSFFDDELSVLYQTNALWIEHRYQGASLPTQWDWTALTIKNGATDMHDIITSFRKHYAGRFVTTGASKGGVTATYHKYFFKDDVEGSIPYVAPASRARVDSIYQTHLTTNYASTCAQTLRDAQVAALTTRRSMMQARLSAFAPGQEALYLEYMVGGFDWSFWQYYGITFCNQVPTAAATDNNFYNFFAQFSGFDGASPAEGDEERSWGALYYEWLTEQGFALQKGSHVAAHLTQPEMSATMEDNFHEMFPDVVLPAYDGHVTIATRGWVREYADDVLLIYGQYDPWTGGMMDQPMRHSSGRFFVPNATHGARLLKLTAADKAAALAIATRFFGVEPQMTMMAAAVEAGNTRDAILRAKGQRAERAVLRSRLSR